MTPRALTSGLMLALLSGSCALAQDAPTRFRKHHTLFIEARAGREVTMDLTAIRASLGYPDALAYRIYGPDGRSAGQGRLEPGEQDTLKLKPTVDGLYVLDGNPGMNAFSVGIEGATWAVDLGETRQLNVISHARPLYFHVPTGLDEFVLKLGGEAADVKLSRPDGTEALTRKLGQYEAVDLTVPVAKGQHGWWRLKLKLSEDQGIQFGEGLTPYVSEAPLSDELLAALAEGRHLVDFDLRPTPRQQLVSAGGEVKWLSGTDDGLELGFGDTGRLVSVKCDEAQLVDEHRPQLIGLFVRDVARDSDLIAFEGKPDMTEEALRVLYVAPNAELTADVVYKPARDHIRVEVEVANQAKADRAITVYFALPFPIGEPRWWDDIVTKRPATGNRTVGAFNSVGAGANGRHSTHPFGCVAGEQGLALAIPMDHPLLHRIAACPATRQLFLAVDLGLTDATTKSPNRAQFSFVLYRCDARWGLRSAAERYYRLFPQLFEKRMPEDGGWVCWGTCEGMPNLKELGFKYHWGPAGPEAVAFADNNELYSFLYNDSCRYFADLGQFDHRPKREEAVAAMRRLLDAPDPRAQVLSARDSATGRRRYEGREKSMGREAAEKWLRDSLSAVKSSAALDANGDPQVGYLVNRKDWGGEDWWTGRVYCNIDPDMPGGYGQFLFHRILDPTVATYRDQGAELDGFGLDNYFSNANSLDFSREHLAYADYPVTFATGDFRPLLVGDTVMYEWVKELKRRLEAEGKWLMANTCGQRFPFAQHLLDMNGLEWNLAASAPLTRTLAYQKQVVTLPVKPEHYEEAFVKSHLPMGVFPGGYGGHRNFAPGTETSKLYAKYVPIIKRLSAAGWEPIPWATADLPEVSIERFGDELPMLFSVHNRGKEPVDTAVTVELARAGAGVARSARDLVSGADVAASVQDSKLSFQVELAASDATVVEVR